METKYFLTLDKEFIQYCELNNITDINKLAKEVFKKGFVQLKYGSKPKMSSNEIIPVVPKPVGLESTLKEEVRETKTENKVQIPSFSKKIVTDPQKDLYEE